MNALTFLLVGAAILFVVLGGVAFLLVYALNWAADQESQEEQELV